MLAFSFPWILLFDVNNVILFCNSSLDGASESIDLKRQLQNVEQEASILRTKNQTLEMDYEKLLAENKKLQLSKGSKKGGLLNSSQFELKGKIAALEKELEEANKKVYIASLLYARRKFGFHNETYKSKLLPS